MADVSVIIPNYNGIKYIENCLLSVLKSDMECDITVVDNGSTDGSCELVESRFKDVRLIRLNKNTGFSGAVNAGIKASDAPYVFLLNNDTVIKENTISRLYRAITQSPNAFAYQAMMVKLLDESIVDSAGDYYCALGWAYALGKDNKAADYEKYTSRRRVFSACAGAAMYCREIFDKIGLFDENHFLYLEDVDIGYRAKLFGYDSYMLPDAVVLHAGSASTGSRYNELKTSYASRNSIYLIYKNMPAWQILLNLPFLFMGYLIKTLFFIRKGLGMTYLRGLLSGIRLCFTNEARKHKIKYDKNRRRIYFNIQIMLYLNIIRRMAL